MKLVRMNDMKLDECVRAAQDDRIVLTSDGKPVALIVGVRGLDLEQIELGLSDEFWTLIRERRKQKTFSRAALEEKLKQPSKATRTRS